MFVKGLVACLMLAVSIAAPTTSVSPRTPTANPSTSKTPRRRIQIPLANTITLTTPQTNGFITFIEGLFKGFRGGLNGELHTYPGFNKWNILSDQQFVIDLGTDDVGKLQVFFGGNNDATEKDSQLVGGLRYGYPQDDENNNNIGGEVRFGYDFWKDDTFFKWGLNGLAAQADDPSRQ